MITDIGILMVKKEQMLQMLKTLEASVDRYESGDQDSFVRDSVCTRFNYCIEGFWKYLRYELEHLRKIKLQKIQDRAVINAAKVHNLISQEEEKFLLAMLEERDKAPDLYDQEVACEVTKWAPELLKQLRIITLRL